MANDSNIAWTNATWNPTRGCERVSDGCRKCYAEVLAARHSYPGGWGAGLAKWVKRPDGTREARWTGAMELMDNLLDFPLRRRQPARIFVNSMSDLFHKDVPDDFIDKVFAVMESVGAGRHTFQILTKRPERMHQYLHRRWSGGDVPAGMRRNIWIGVSAEDQDTFDERVEILGRTPAAVRFVSAEPFLSDIDIGNSFDDPADGKYSKLDWAIVGGESGTDYRPMDIEAARAFITQVKLMGGKVFVKQDNGHKPGMQGRFTDKEFAMKEYPQ